MVVFKGRVIDGNGGTPIEEGLVAVDGNKIKDRGPNGNNTNANGNIATTIT